MSVTPSGLSPRMRGTHLAERQNLHAVRFIPAHAGNTPCRLHGVFTEAVYPRACGEHIAKPLIRKTECGLSPRMRGTLADNLSGDLKTRFIPAHAGNTRVLKSRCASAPVYPRACGEHLNRFPLAFVLIGLSPRMRGTRKDFMRVLAIVRFIPAHAGNTRPSRRQATQPTVYPRACGEHRAKRQTEPVRRGLSPRMRGTPFVVVQFRDFQRFIPAHAGNTIWCQDYSGE